MNWSLLVGWGQDWTQAPQENCLPNIFRIMCKGEGTTTASRWATPWRKAAEIRRDGEERGELAPCAQCLKRKHQSQHGRRYPELPAQMMPLDAGAGPRRAHFSLQVCVTCAPSTSQPTFHLQQRHTRASASGTGRFVRWKRCFSPDWKT